MTTPIRVLFVAPTWELGGAEVQLLALLQRLPATVSPVVVTNPGSPLIGRLQALGVVHVSVPSLTYLLRGARWPATAARQALSFAHACGVLRRLSRALRVDVVHTWLEPAVKYGPALAAAGIRTICTFHEGLLPPYSALHRRALVTALQCHDRVIVPSRASARLLTAAGLPDARVHVLHNAVAVPADDVEGVVRARRSFAVQDDARVVLQTGRLEPQKGHTILVEALRVVRARHPRAHLVILGDATSEVARAHRDAVEALTRAHDLAGAVRWLGWRDDVAACLRAADVLVHPSLAHDTLPGVILEAMAAGCPVVASRVGGVDEMIEDGVTGLLVPPRDAGALAEALCRLFDQPHSAVQFATAARARAESGFGWPRYLSALETHYVGLAHVDLQHAFVPRQG